MARLKTVIAKRPCAEVAVELQSLQRKRTVLIKSRIMQANRLQAVIAGTIGYSNDMPEKDRQKKFKEANDLIKRVCKGEERHPLEAIILVTMRGIEEFNTLQAEFDKEMVKLAKTLHVAEWVELPEQKGFGLSSLAVLIGETGDLNNYSTLWKIEKRMGMAPFKWAPDGVNEKILMGATWRSGMYGKLSSEAWEQFGYSPRRRSIAYMIGENLIKQNFLGKRVKVSGSKDPSEQGITHLGNGHASEMNDLTDHADTLMTNGDGEERVATEDVTTTPSLPSGPYRAKYDEAKKSFKEKHPNYSDLRCHRHGMLLCTELLIKRLYQQWKKG